MSTQNNGGHAFPASWSPQTETYIEHGMSLRDYFAAKCDVKVYCPFETLRGKLGRVPEIGELAQYVVKIRMIEADAMLAASEVQS